VAVGRMPVGRAAAREAIAAKRVSFLRNTILSTLKEWN
jgi:hypothetical protein